jgi:hypothetical protein
MNRKNRAVKNSGKELAMAFILAPRTPSVRFTPITLECLSKFEQERHNNTEQAAITTSGNNIPIIFMV